MNELNLAMLIQKKKTTNSIYELSKLKKISSQLIEKYIQTNNITNDESILSGDSMFSTQIYSSDIDESSLKEASINNKFPLFYFKQCEEVMRMHYNIQFDIYNICKK
jgi:hypothetical protein